MITNPIEVKHLIEFHGTRYAYWKLREIGGLKMLNALYLIWVAKGTK